MKEEITSTLNSYRHDEETFEEYKVKFIAFRKNTGNPSRIIKEYENIDTQNNEKLYNNYIEYIELVRYMDKVGRNPTKKSDDVKCSNERLLNKYKYKLYYLNKRLNEFKETNDTAKIEYYQRKIAETERNMELLETGNRKLIDFNTTKKTIKQQKLQTKDITE